MFYRKCYIIWYGNATDTVEISKKSGSSGKEIFRYCITKHRNGQLRESIK